MFKTIIWATDGSEIADGALPFAKELAEAGGRIVVVHSNEKFSGRASGYPILADEQELEAKIRTQVEDLRQEGLRRDLHARQRCLGGGRPLDRRRRGQRRCRRDRRRHPWP